MEVVQFVPQLGIALWNLKGMYDQYVENQNEIKELQSFIQDYEHQIPILRERFQGGGDNVMGIATFKNLERNVMEATNKLERWSRNKSFFRVFNSVERMQKLEKLHSRVMASLQKSLGIANLSLLLDLQATQATILESNAEMKSLLITSIGSMQGTLPVEVRDEVVEASTSSFADPKFWEDVLAAVDNHNAGVAILEEKNMYEDPITTNLMIDPIVASDGNTYRRWTIIDNNLTRNPFNVDEDLIVVIDNLTFRRGLFEKFPEQYQIFVQRRKEYRSHALSLRAQGLWGDAALALHYVLQWDKCHVECIEALEQVRRALQEAKEKYLQPSIGLSNDMKSTTLVSCQARNLELTQRQVPKLLELTGLIKDEHDSLTDLYSGSTSSDEMSGELSQKFTIKDMAKAIIFSFATVLVMILFTILIVCVFHVQIDTVVNYKNDITESSSSPIDTFEIELFPKHSTSFGQFGEGPETSSVQEIHQTIDVSIGHEEHSIQDIQDNSKGTIVVKQIKMSRKASGMSGFVRKLMSGMSNEKKEKKDISTSMKFYGGKLKHGLHELELLHRFSSSDIKRMTNNFNNENIIRLERHYKVYKGFQAGIGATVAVMRFQKDFAEVFKMEVELVSQLHHKYVVALVGYCLEHDPTLIYEYPDNGSLYDHLHGTLATGNTLNWRRRLHIALNVARGLEYLHMGYSPGIVHMNVTSKNILLTLEFDAKVTSFELTEFMRETKDTIPIVGSVGYLDPEYYTTHYLSTKSDVYSFGIILLELITGSLPIDQSKLTKGKDPHIANWVRKRLLDNNIDSILAPMVKASNPRMDAIWKVAEIAMESIEPRAVHRPTMAQVVQDLQGALTLE